MEELFLSNYFIEWKRGPNGHDGRMEAKREEKERGEVFVHWPRPFSLFHNFPLSQRFISNSYVKIPPFALIFQKWLRSWDLATLWKLWESNVILLLAVLFRKLDEKGFLSFAEYRWSHQNGCFSLALILSAIYRKSDIEKIVQRFQSKQHIGKFQKFFTLFFSTLHQTTCDKVGRVLLPPQLKKAVNIKSEIVVAGVLNKIEIWPKERYDAQLDAVLGGKDSEIDLAQMCEEAFALLDADGAREKR
jgi:division/cell wall cluster transcriptional repressor MraZ